MIKMFFKLAKYSIIIYLMICFKNLYGITPSIIELNDIHTSDEITIFAEKMESQKLQTSDQEELDQQAQSSQSAVTAESYRKLLEQGLIKLPAPTISN